MSNENKRIDLTQFEQDYEDLEGEIYFLLKYADPYKPKVSNALRHLPKLITELKLVYKEIDDLERQYQSCNEALVETTNWNVRMVEAIDSGKMSEIKRVRNS